MQKPRRDSDPGIWEIVAEVNNISLVIAALQLSVELGIVMVCVIMCSCFRAREVRGVVG